MLFLEEGGRLLARPKQQPPAMGPGMFLGTQQALIKFHVPFPPQASPQSLPQ